MKERVDIVVDERRIAKNGERAERLRRARAFERTDRIPVMINTNQWTLLRARGRTCADYLRSPRDNLREQILNLKWKLENIDDDTQVSACSVSFSPDLGCIRGVEFDMEVTWSDDQPPKCTHPLTEPEQLDALAVPDPDNGVNARRIEWYRAMRACAGEFDVRMNGEPLQVRIGIGQPGGPMPSAFALAGQNLFLWMATDPDRVHRLMEVVTMSQLNCIAFFDELTGRDAGHGVGLGADTIELIGPGMFREFVVPYYDRIWQRYPGGREIHNCGRNDHLLDALRDDMKVTANNGFGFCVPPELLAEKLGGRVFLSGGPSPMLVKDGRPDEIRAATGRYIDLLGPGGGFVLTLGGGTAAGTPVENYGYVIEEARSHAFEECRA